jgi:hypothetical protein
MPRSISPFWLIAVVPLAFILHSWIISGGLPYHTDANESFSAYVMGRNLVRFGGWNNAFLPDDANSYDAAAHPFTYTHGPNLPRYFSAALMLAGVSSLSWQILLTAIATTLLSLWFIRHAFPELIEGGAGSLTFTVGGLLATVFCLDMIGTLQFLVNLWRAWHFPLFWGCVWAVRTRPRPVATFLLFFLLFQLEFLFALFTAASCLGYLLWVRCRTKSDILDGTLLVAVLGCVASVGLFVLQLLAFYGWDGFVFDLRTTYLARNTNAVEWDTIRRFYEDRGIMMWASTPSWDFSYGKFLSVTLEQMVRRIGVLAVASVLVGLALSIALAGVRTMCRLNRASKTSTYNTIDPLLWTTTLAYLALGLLIPGYTLNGYTYRWAPLLVFPVELSLALLTVHLASLLTTAVETIRARSSWGPPVWFPISALAVIPVVAVWAMVGRDAFLRHPTFVHTPATSLASTYSGRTFVSQTTFPHMVAYYTKSWSYYSTLVFPGTAPLDQSHNWNADRNRNAAYEKPEFYLCERLPYYSDLDCDKVGQQMTDLGHTVVERAPDYVIIKLNWRLPS